MDFDINAFRSTINSVDGLASPCYFAVYFVPPPFVSGLNGGLTGFNNSELSLGLSDSVNMPDTYLLSFLCDTANLPGQSLQLIDYKPQGFGEVQKRPFNVSFDNISLTFFIDNKFGVLNYFNYWFQEIMNTGSEFQGQQSTFKDRTPREINYFRDYTTTMVIRFFASGNPDNYIEYVMKDVYPIQIGQVSLGWEQSDTIAKLPVEFTFSSYTTFRDLLSVGTYLSRGIDYYQSSRYFNSLVSTLLGKKNRLSNTINDFTHIF